MTNASYEQMSDNLLKLRQAWQAAVQSDKQSLVHSLFLKVCVYISMGI